MKFTIHSAMLYVYESLNVTSGQEIHSSFLTLPISFALLTFSLHLNFSFACVFLAGGDWPHEKEMQVPWDFRQLPAEDMLAGHAGVPTGGLNPQRTLPHRHSDQGSQSKQRAAWPLTTQQPPQQPPQPSPSSPEQPPQSSPPPHASAAAKHQRAGVFWEVTRFLWARPGVRFSGHAGPDLQQDQPWHGQLWESVLWERPQHPAADAQRTLQLQVSLVLLCGVWRVQNNRVG